MPRLRSILGLILCLVAAFGGPHASGQIVVTGRVVNAWGVAQTNVPVTLTPYPAQQPRAVGSYGVMTGTGVRSLTDADGYWSGSPYPGFYSVQIGALATKAWLIEVGTNSGTFDWTSLITTNGGLGFATNGFPVMLGATALADGQAGLVPAPSAGDEDKAFFGSAPFWRNVSGGSGDGSYERVEAGSNIGVSSSTSGGTNVFTVSAGSGLATDAELTTATNTLSGSLVAYADSLVAALSSVYQPISAALTALAIGNGSALTNLAHSSTVSAGANITVNESTNPDGSTDYEVVGSAGGGAGSYERVVAGTGIMSTPSSSGGTNVFTVAVDSTIATETYAETAAASAASAATNNLGSAAFTLSSDYQPADTELDEWATAGTNRLSVYLTSATAATTYQAKDTDLDEWAAAGTNRLSVYLTSATAATTYQAKDTDLDEWADAGTNRLGTYALKSFSDSATTALTNAIAAQTNFFGITVSNNVGYGVSLLAPSSQLTNYVVPLSAAEMTINGTNAIRLTAVSDAVSGRRFFSGIKITNYTGSAVSFAFTNAWKPIGIITNSIGANTRARVVIENSGGETSIAVVVY